MSEICSDNSEKSLPIIGVISTPSETPPILGGEFLSVKQAAQILKRSPYTIRRWIKERKLSAIKYAETGPKGQWLVYCSSIASRIKSATSNHSPGSQSPC